MNTERYSVKVARDHLVFACGHFISFDGHRCERLHGHNYRAEVTVEGPLNEDGCVFDFIALRARAKEITDELDHHMLVPTGNPIFQVFPDDRIVHIIYKDREWLFPRGDCVVLPIENTTAELIAKYLAARLASALKQRHQFVPELLRVEVEESVGVSAIYEWRG